MKALMVLMVAFGCSQTLNAQNNPFPKINPIDENKLKQLLNDTLRLIKPKTFYNYKKFVPQQTGVLRFPLKGTFIMENNKGNEIYNMELDNMACLTPGKNFVDKMVAPNIAKTENDDFLLKRNNNITGVIK